MNQFFLLMRALAISVLICVVFCVYPGNLFAQSGSVHYKIAAISALENPTNNQKIEAGTKRALEVTYTLDFNSSQSRFVSDGNEMDVDFQDRDKTRGRLLYSSHYDFWFDRGKKIVVKRNPRGELIEETFADPEWEITSESRKIDGRDCYKAVTYYKYTSVEGKEITRTTTAWFAPELPYAFGPMNYNGLPGLVLELHDGKGTVYLADKIELVEGELAIEWPKGKKKSAEEYKKEVENSPVFRKR